MDYYITDFKQSASAAVALEDSIMKKGSPTTAGSKMLSNFVAPFDAEVVARLRNAEIAIAGKTQMSEFGIGGVFTAGAGTLSGAAQALLGGNVSSCLCNDLFGQYRREAAENDLCYIHPTYGTVSRYGLIPLASSMDQIGVMCKDLSAGFALLSAIAGHDAKDGAMFPDENYRYEKTDKTLTIGLPAHIIEQADEDTQNAIRAFADHFTVTDAPLDYFDVYKQVMYVLSCAEISNNISRYDGIKFGYRSADSGTLENLYTNTRTEAFEPETKLAAIMGAAVLSAEHYVRYYNKAMKLRRLIKESLRFDRCDLIALPASFGGRHYDNLSLYAAATLAGLPSVSFSYQGCGIQLIANVKNEAALLTAWEVTRS